MSPHQVLGPNAQLSDFISDQFPPGHRGYGLDIGASDGISISSTYTLEKNYGWHILCVEPNPFFKELLHKHRTFIEICACDKESGDSVPFKVHADNPEAYSSLRPRKHPTNKPSSGAKWHTIRVPVRTVDQLLFRWEFPRLDLLAVDVEGMEFDVLKGCDFNKWMPHVVVVETWDEVGDADDWLSEKGYRKVWRTVHNDVWVHRRPRG